MIRHVNGWIGHARPYGNADRRATNDQAKNGRRPKITLAPSSIHCGFRLNGRPTSALSPDHLGLLARARANPTGQQKLLDLVPTDGSTIGNAAVRDQLGWSEERYSTAKDALVASGALLKRAYLHHVVALLHREPGTDPATLTPRALAPQLKIH